MEQLVSVVGVVIPMITIAGSAAAFVWKSFSDSRENRRKQFFQLMTLIDADGSIASKIAAVYQLRNFPEHSDFIIRFCDTQRNNLTGNGTAVALLAKEMNMTMDFFNKQEVIEGK